MLRRPLISRTPWLMKSHAGPPQNGGLCWPALTRRRRRSRPVVQIPTRARQERAGCYSSLSLVANARAAPGRRSRLGTWPTRNGLMPAGQVGELWSDFYVCQTTADVDCDQRGDVGDRETVASDKLVPA